MIFILFFIKYKQGSVSRNFIESLATKKQYMKDLNAIIKTKKKNYKQKKRKNDFKSQKKLLFQTN